MTIITSHNLLGTSFRPWFLRCKHSRVPPQSS